MVLKFGHRGAMGYEPENTLRSFKKAVELQVDMVEFDVYVCKSGELVVIHDETVDRTTNGSGPVEEMTLQELRALDAGRDEKIPVITEVLDVLDRKVKVNMELKGLGTSKPICEVITQYITKHGWEYADFLVSSFNHDELRTLKQLDPRIDIGVLTIGTELNGVDRGLLNAAFSINVNYDSVTMEFIDAMHSKGLRVFVWTVDDHNDIATMKSLGVDGIFSNFPDRI